MRRMTHSMSPAVILPQRKLRIKSPRDGKKDSPACSLGYGVRLWRMYGRNPSPPSTDHRALANLLVHDPEIQQARRERVVKQQNVTCATVFLREKAGCGLAVAGRRLPPGNFPSLDNVGRTLAKDWRRYAQTQIWVVVERRSICHES